MDDQAIAITWAFGFADLIVFAVACHACQAVPYAERMLRVVAGVIFASQLVTIVLTEWWGLPPVPTACMDAALSVFVTLAMLSRPCVWVAVVWLSLCAQVGVDLAHGNDDPADDAAFFLYAAIYDFLFACQLAAILTRCVWLLATHRVRRGREPVAT